MNRLKMKVVHFAHHWSEAIDWWKITQQSLKIFNPASKYVFEVINGNYMHVVYFLLMYPKFPVQAREHCSSSLFIVDFEHIQKIIQPI